MRQRPHHQVPGVEVLGRLASGAKILRRIELRLDRRDDGLGDLVLHGEHVGEVAVVAFRPDVAAAGNVDELRGDAHTVAALAHAALDDVADAEFLGDLPHVHGLALVGKGRVARNHEEPAQLRQAGNDVLADSVGEILLLQLAAHIDKGEYGDRGPVRQLQCRARRPVGCIRRRIQSVCRFGAIRLRPHIADEAQALAGHSADQLLLLAAVSDCCSGSVDTAGQRRVRDDPAFPYRGEDFILADDPVAVLRQVSEKVEYLRFDMHGHAGAPELSAFEIDFAVVKAEDHSRARDVRTGTPASQGKSSIPSRGSRPPRQHYLNNISSPSEA